MPLERGTVSDRKAAPRAPVDRHVVFTCGGVRYALDARAVRHSLPARGSEGTAVTFLGVRYPLLDVRALFGVPAAVSGGVALVADRLGRCAALVVDEFVDLAIVDEEAVHPLPPAFRGRERGWFMGVTRVNGHIAVVLRLSGILEP
jgi:hypothetical protein